MRTSKDPSTLTVLAEDSAAIAGLAIAATGIVAAHLLAEPRLDGAASIGIGAVLATVAILLARESRGLLIGEGADPETVEHLRTIAERSPGIRRVGRIRTMHLGPSEILVTMRVQPAAGHDPVAAIAELRARLLAEEPRARDVTIEPVSPASDPGEAAAGDSGDAAAASG